MTDSILAVPGLAAMTPDFLRALADLADRNGWSADGIAAVISHESRFNAQAHTPIPGQTATGLIQFIESTAKKLGTTTAALLGMTAIEQLPFVERFFDLTLQGRKPQEPDEYILATYGRADLIGKPDSYVIDRKDASDPKEAERYRVNAALDAGQKGYISVGDLRHSVRGTLNAAGGERIDVPPLVEAEPSSSESC